MRQKPGEKNSLGLAKFIFPNSENVYMHGTPAQSLFARARRDFSHGCIRLEDPAAARRSGCCATRRSGRGSGSTPPCRASRPTQVNLKQKLTVFLFYDTAYVDSKGVVYFADDYYGHDAQLDEGAASGLPLPAQELRMKARTIGPADPGGAAAARRVVLSGRSVGVRHSHRGRTAWVASGRGSSQAW